MSLDTTMNYEISGPGGGGNSPGEKLDTLMETSVGSTPSKGGSPARNTSSPKLGKPESSDVIKSVFYEDVKGSPGSLDSTLDSVLEISFNK